MNDGFTVSKLAALVGSSPDTIRYYERIGLLPEPARSSSGYRLYGDDAVTRMRFIKGAQRLGLHLEEIGELLSVKEQGLCPCGHTRQLLNGKLAQIDTELTALQTLRDEVQRMLDDGLSVGMEDDSCGTAALPCGTVRVELLGRKEGGVP